MTDALLTDEVWAALDPDAGSVAQHDRARWLLGLVAATVVAIAVPAVSRGGVMRPRMSVDPMGWNAEHGSGEFSYGMAVYTDALIPVHVSRVAPPETPGLELVSVTGLPATVTRSESIDVELVYRVTDCQAVESGQVPVSLVVKRFWGEQTVDAPGPPQPADGPAPDDDLFGDDFFETAPDEQPWSERVVELACSTGPAHEPE